MLTLHFLCISPHITQKDLFESDNLTKAEIFFCGVDSTLTGKLEEILLAQQMMSLSQCLTSLLPRSFQFNRKIWTVLGTEADSQNSLISEDFYNYLADESFSLYFSGHLNSSFPSAQEQDFSGKKWKLPCTKPNLWFADSWIVLKFVFKCLEAVTGWTYTSCVLVEQPEGRGCNTIASLGRIRYICVLGEIWW